MTTLSCTLTFLPKYCLPPSLGEPGFSLRTPVPLTSPRKLPVIPWRSLRKPLHHECRCCCSVWCRVQKFEVGGVSKSASYTSVKIGIWIPRAYVCPPAYNPSTQEGKTGLAGASWLFRVAELVSSGFKWEALPWYIRMRAFWGDCCFDLWPPHTCIQTHWGINTLYTYPSWVQEMTLYELVIFQLIISHQF